MSHAKVGAYLWYPRDFAADEHVVMMTLAQEGAYRRLLDHQWLHGSIPAALADLAKLCKGQSVPAMRKLWEGVEPCFVPLVSDPGRLVNPKLERIRQEAAEYRANQQRAGRLGGIKTQAALKQASSEPSSPAQAAVKLASPSPSPSPSPEREHTHAEATVRAELPEDCRAAFDGLLKSSANPLALVGEIQMIGTGHRIPGATWAHVGAALRDHALNGTQRLTGLALRSFVQKAMQESEPRPSRVPVEDDFDTAIRSAQAKEAGRAR